MVKDNILIGNSGWSYKEWEGSFYRKSEKSKLRAYSRVFRTVEIDSTWYRYPSKGAVLGWLRYSPADFVFVAKIPKIITHEKKLGLDGSVKFDLESFLDLMQPLQLNGKLACLLIQLPPSYKYNLDGLESFFKLLQPPHRYAVEFRHLSWVRNETWELLKRYGVAYVSVDEPLLPPEVHLTTDFAYFRWHGRGMSPWFNYKYTEEELEPWVKRVEESASEVKRVVGYFNNHFHGYAPEDSANLIKRLGLQTEERKNAAEKGSKEQKGLADYF